MEHGLRTKDVQELHMLLQMANTLKAIETARAIKKEIARRSNGHKNAA